MSASLGDFQITQTGPNTISISSGAVAHTDFDSDDNYWMASWESAISFDLKQFTQSTNSYGALSSGGTWMLGVERLSTGRAVIQMALLSGTTGTTPQATYSGMVGSWNDNFIPLAQITRSGSSISSIASYRNFLYEGRFAQQPILSVVGKHSTSPVIYDGSGSTNIDSAVLTITDRSAGSYVIDGKAQVMTYETGATPYWADTYFGSTIGSGDNQFSLGSSSQIARDSSGNIYIADTGNDRIKKHDSSGAFVSNIITGLDQVQSVCLDPSGNIYTVYFNGAFYRLQKYNAAGVLQWSGALLTGSNFTHIATDGTYIYASHGTSNVVSRHLCSTGGTDGSFGSSGTGDGQFSTVSAIATDGTYVYVVDQGNHRIQKFTLSGAYVSKWGTSGYGDGQFTTPVGIAVHPINGNIFVTDSGRDDIQEFTNAGVFVRTYGSGVVGNPAGIVLSSTGLVIYVANPANGRIIVFTYTTPPDGLEWYDLVCEMFYKINAGAWTSMGSKNVTNFSQMPDFWSFAEDSGAISLSSGDTVQFRVTLSNGGSGSIAWSNMNYQFRLLPLGSV